MKGIVLYGIALSFLYKHSSQLVMKFRNSGIRETDSDLNAKRKKKSIKNNQKSRGQISSFQLFCFQLNGCLNDKHNAHCFKKSLLTKGGLFIKEFSSDIKIKAFKKIIFFMTSICKSHISLLLKTIVDFCFAFMIWSSDLLDNLILLERN